MNNHITKKDFEDALSFFKKNKTTMFGGVIVHEYQVDVIQEELIGLTERAEKAEAKINKYHHEMMEAQMFIRDNGHTPSFIEYRKRYDPSASTQSPNDDDLKREGQKNG